MLRQSLTHFAAPADLHEPGIDVPLERQQHAPLHFRPSALAQLSKRRPGGATVVEHLQILTLVVVLPPLNLFTCLLTD